MLQPNDDDVITTMIALSMAANVEQWEARYSGFIETVNGDSGLPVIDEIADAIRKLQRVARRMQEVVRQIERGEI